MLCQFNHVDVECHTLCFRLDVERFEENETDWLNKSTIYRMKINELIDEDAKKKDIIGEILSLYLSLKCYLSLK